MSIEGSPDSGQGLPHEDLQGWGADSLRNPEAVLDEAIAKERRTLDEAVIGPYDLRNEIDRKYLELLNSDDFWRKLDHRLSLADSPALRAKTVRLYTQRAAELGTYSKEEIEEFARLHGQHYGL